MPKKSKFVILLTINYLKEIISRGIEIYAHIKTYPYFIRKEN